MRDRVTITLGGQEYPLLPTFSVLDQFEDKHGSILAHLVNMMNLVAPLKARSYLVFLAMKAAREDDGGDTSKLRHTATAEAMFEAGIGDEGLIQIETELIERLIYTPEQYAAKKEQREKEAMAQKEAMALLSAFPAFSESPLPPSDGSHPSSGDLPPASSSPP